MLVSFAAAKDKVFYLSAFGKERGSRNPEVPDPNLGTLEDVRRCYRALDLHVGNSQPRWKQSRRARRSPRSEMEGRVVRLLSLPHGLLTLDYGCKIVLIGQRLFSGTMEWYLQ